MGAAFIITFSVGAPAPGAASNGHGARKAGEDIYLAEDDEQMRRIEVRLLEGFGGPVEAAGGFSDLLELLRTRPPRLLVTDLHMPGMSALDFFEETDRAGLLDGIPILVVSGSPIGETLARRFEEPGYALLRKPFDIKEFQDTVAGLLR